ncbi:c-type cytochrome [Agrilutibacter solisilvae]|uniref:C-type cytochrome n=1 Tax=Agrilutibacter solisilvae TaxID=2763317 RepID=A0A974Y122_9GAMM|nr:c-type cytochrome [Lysobacter solisilvae]QSX79457.1 c-type cytochrome [Lysobacter solisilvae]
MTTRDHEPMDATEYRRLVATIAAFLVAILVGAGFAVQTLRGVRAESHAGGLSPAMIAQGQRIFRFDTFGDEKLWTDQLQLHTVVEHSVDPTTALSVGLKVDADALPPGILDTADLTSPATTVAMLKLKAVVGLQATVDADNHITKLGVTCALCHSTVDDSVMPGIGHRKDGWPNRDLDVGRIIALSPALPRAKKAVYNGWGPGKYDPRYNIDGLNTPLVLPPAHGLKHIRNETYTGDAPISYWNAYVAVTQMGGQGNFADPRLGINVTHTPDLVTPKLPALRAYQLSLRAPAPPAGSFDKIAATRGRAVFGQHCISCHVGASGSDNNGGKLHAPAETGMDGAYAARTVNKAYRTTPLRGLWQHPPYFHDGSAATLEDVVAHYDQVRALGLSQAQRRDVVEYLKTL